MYLCIIWPPVCTLTLSFARRCLWAFALAPSAIAGLASSPSPCLSHAGTLIHRCQLRCCCPVAQSCPTLCDPIDCSTPGLPGLSYLPWCLLKVTFPNNPFQSSYHQSITLSHQLTELFTSTSTTCFPGGSVVKNLLPAMQEKRVPPLVQKAHLEKEMAAHSNIVAWRIPWTEESGRLTVHGVTKELDMN